MFFNYRDISLNVKLFSYFLKVFEVTNSAPHESTLGQLLYISLTYAYDITKNYLLKKINMYMPMMILLFLYVCINNKMDSVRF